jgi:hypothetical protein
MSETEMTKVGSCNEPNWNFPEVFDVGSEFTEVAFVGSNEPQVVEKVLR